MSLRQESSSYEASDESSENELLDRSLSLWRGWVAVDDDDDDDFSPCPLDLHTASSIGHYECVRTIISRKEMDINRCNKGGWTPLMYSCYIGHENILTLLLKADADVNITNHKGQTALMLAASCGNERVAHCLCQNGAEMEGQDWRGWTVLFHATFAGHQNMVKFLLERKANMNAREPSSGLTPFMEAAAGGHEIIVQIFLQHGVSLNAKTYSGDTAQSLALMNGHMNIVNLINQHMAARDKDVNLSDDPTAFLAGHRPPNIGRPIRNKMARAPPDIRDGPDAFARLIERSKTSEPLDYPSTYVPEGYITFTQGNEEREDTHLRYRDVTSPINAQDHNLDSSGSKDSYDAEDESTAFSRTGALTIRSSSSSSGGLAAALGLSPDNSENGEDILAPSLAGIIPQESRDISSELHSAFPTDLHHPHSSLIPATKELITDNSRAFALALAHLDINSTTNDEGKYFPDRGHSSDPCRPTWGTSVCEPQIGTNEGFTILSGNRYNPFCAGGKSIFHLPTPDNQEDFKPLAANQYSFHDMEPQSEQGLPQLPFALQNPLIDPYTRTSNFPPKCPSTSEQNQIMNEKRGSAGTIPDLRSPALTEKPFLQERSESNPEHFNLDYLSPTTTFPTSAENKAPTPYYALENQTSTFDGFPQVQTTTSANSLFSTDITVSTEGSQHPSSPCDPGSSPVLPPNSPKLDLANGMVSPSSMHCNSSKPETLAELLLQLGLLKYQTIFEEQDVDLQVFLSLTDNDLKEIGIKLFGPRRKMTSAIARWHSDVRSPSDGLERAYADRLEAEMQEMAIQLHQANSQVKTLEAQVLQEQKLRSVTEGCFMEERALRQREKRQLEDLCMRCEQTQEVFERLRHYHADFRERLVSSFPSLRDQKDPEILKNVDQLTKKVEHCSNDLKQTLDLVFKTIESLLRQENSPPSYLSPPFS